MTPEVLIRTIRQIPGVATVRRWTRHGEDRAYITFTARGMVAHAWVDLRTAELSLRFIEDEEPHTVARRIFVAAEERAVKTIRELCEQYKAATA